MWLAWALIWWCGAFIAFGPTFLRYNEGKYKNKSILYRSLIITFLSILSWISVIREMYLINKEVKQEENKFKDYGKTKQERD